MSVLLSTHDLGFELQHKTLFKALSVSIGHGERIALVGKNGAGKTTLLKILAGLAKPTAGHIDKHEAVRYLPQLDFTLFEHSDTVARFLELQEIPWSDAQVSIAQLFGAASFTPEREMCSLSGGELAKLLIAISNLAKPDVLLLDEPTNHLDAEGLETLAQYLAEFRGAFVVVSHDPRFLDRVATTVWELADESITRYGGNYSYYRAQKQLIEEARERDFEAAKKSVRKARKAIERRETRVSRAERAGKRAKSEQGRDKMAEAHHKNMAEREAGKLKRRQDKTLAERAQRVESLRKPKRNTTHAELETGADRSRRMLVSITSGTLHVGPEELLRNLNLRIEFGDRIAIAGKNGSGKSSLAKTLIEAASAATLDGNIKRSERLEAVYMDQKYATVDPERSLIGNIQKENPYLDEQAVRGMLGKFLFSADMDVKKKAGTLSGGETARLTLAQTTARPIDLLILDEPTNNLDIETLDSIATALEDFPGALVVISHNVRFLARLGIDRAYIITEHSLKQMQSTPEDEELFYTELVTAERSSA